MNYQPLTDWGGGFLLSFIWQTHSFRPSLETCVQSSSSSPPPHIMLVVTVLLSLHDL